MRDCPAMSDLWQPRLECNLVMLHATKKKKKRGEKTRQKKKENVTNSQNQVLLRCKAVEHVAAVSAVSMSLCGSVSSGTRSGY